MNAALLEVEPGLECIHPVCAVFFQVEIPNIQKQRKQLAKLVLDWDSVRAR